MKATTIPQPYASLVTAGTIHVVTRTKPAPQEHLGTRVAIHAAKREVRHGYGGIVGADFRLGSELYVATKGLPEFDEFKEAIAPDDFTCHAGFLNVFLPLGAVIATATLVECLQVASMNDDGARRLMNHNGESVTSTDDDELSDGLGESSVGRWVWFFRDVERLAEPVPARGRQGLWEWEGP